MSSSVPWSRIRVRPKRRPWKTGARCSARICLHHIPSHLVPLSHCQEFKEEQERKRRRELEQAMGLSPAAATPTAAGVSGEQQQQQAGEQALGMVDRFDQAYMKDRLLFGSIVSLYSKAECECTTRSIGHQCRGSLGTNRTLSSSPTDVHTHT